MKKIRNVFHGILFVLAFLAPMVFFVNTDYMDTVTSTVFGVVAYSHGTGEPFEWVFFLFIGYCAIAIAAVLPFLVSFIVVLPFVEITTTSEERRRAKGADKMALLRVKEQRRKDLLVTSRIPIVPLRITPTPTLNQIRRPVDGRGNRRQ